MTTACCGAPAPGQGSCQGIGFDLCLRTTSTYPFMIIIRDAETGDPIDLTGKMFCLVFKRDARDPTPALEYTSFAGDLLVQPGAELGKVAGDIPAADILGLMNASTLNGIWYLTMEPGLGTVDPVQILGGKFTVRGGN